MHEDRSMHKDLGGGGSHLATVDPGSCQGHEQ